VLMSRHNVPKENIIGHREAYKQTPPPKTCPGRKINMENVRSKYGTSGIAKVQPQKLVELEQGKIKITERLGRL